MAGTPPDASNKTINSVDISVKQAGETSLSLIGTIPDAEINIGKESYDINENSSGRPYARLEFLTPPVISGNFQDIYRENFARLLGLDITDEGGDTYSIDISKDKIDTRAQVKVEHTYPSGDSFVFMLWMAHITGDLNMPFSADSLMTMPMEITAAVPLVLEFDVGTNEPDAGDAISGGTSGATATIIDYEIDSGTWGGNDAAGRLFIYAASPGDFTNDETINNTTQASETLATANGTGSLYDYYGYIEWS